MDIYLDEEHGAHDATDSNTQKHGENREQLRKTQAAMGITRSLLLLFALRIVYLTD